MRKITALFVSFFVAPAMGESFLKAADFPKTFEDLSFVAKNEMLVDSYKDFASLSAYDQLIIAQNDQDTLAEIEEDEKESKDEEDNKDADNFVQNNVQFPENNHQNYVVTGEYCKKRASYIPEKQSIPFGNPVSNTDYRIASWYGWRKISGKNDFHYGLDIVLKNSESFGKPVFTTASGVVVRVKRNCKGCSAGNYILIDHGDGFKTYYMHLETIMVKSGQRVEAGCQIGTIGDTGGAKANKNSFANDPWPRMGKKRAHLHYQIEYKGTKTYVINPQTQKRVEIIYPASLGGKNNSNINPEPFVGVKNPKR